jgi:hypothetical protein
LFQQSLITFIVPTNARRKQTFLQGSVDGLKKGPKELQPILQPDCVNIAVLNLRQLESDLSAAMNIDMLHGGEEK